MRSIIFVISLLILVVISTSFCQPIRKTVYKNAGSSEIDRLCEKYKGAKFITLNTTTEDLKGWIDIDSNNSKKPMAISINGSTVNKMAVAEVLVNMIKIKLRQGYYLKKIPIRWDGGKGAVERFERKLEQATVFYLSNSFGDGEYAHGILMIKENMYFRAGVRKTDRQNYNHYIYDWEITTGDLNREKEIVSKKRNKRTFSLDF